jgi:hypothetical protein
MDIQGENKLSVQSPVSCLGIPEIDVHFSRRKGTRSTFLAYM